MAVIFNVYFATVVARDAPIRGLTLWTFLISGSTLLSGILSPYLGALADIRKTRKRWLAGCAGAGAVSTAALFFSGPQTLVLTSAFFVIASVCFTVSLTFYHSFLNDLSTDRTIGSVSGFGWAIGYVGGGLCLALNLAMIQKPVWFGLPEGDSAVRATFLVVGLWWLVFTLPFIFWIKEQRDAAGPPRAGREALRRVMDSIRAARKYNKNIFVFLAAYFLYNDVIETVIVVAGIFAAAELGMPESERIACFLMIQFVAFFGAVAFGRLADRWTQRKALLASLALWAGILLWTTTMTTRAEFWIAGFLISIVLGGSQAVSRSLFGRLVPAGQEAQFFGFWGLSGKISAATGPLIFGIVHEWTGQIRRAILSLLVLLIAGMALLAFVKESREYDRNAAC